MSVDSASLADTTSPAQPVSNRSNDITSSPAQWRAGLRKTGSAGSVDVTDERNTADKLAPLPSTSVSNKPADTSVYQLFGMII